MPGITEAKHELARQFRAEHGFVGVGIAHRPDGDALRVYVVDPDAPVAQRPRQIRVFAGFPVELEVSGDVRAY